MLTLAYSAYGQPLLRLLVNPYTIFWVVGALVVYCLRSRRDSLSMAYAIAAVGFAFCYFIQNKGFLYHVITTTGLLFIALGIMLPSRKQARNSSVVFVGTMSALLVAWIMPLLFGFMITSKTEDLEAVEDLLRGTPRGASIIMLTVDPWRIWPMVEDQGYAWPSRYFSLWMLPAFALEEQANGNLSVPMQELARDVRAQTAADLTCNPPELIIVDDVRQLRANGIDMLAFFAEDDDFRRFFANYEKAETRTVGTDHQFASFVRRQGWQPTAPPAGCRKIH
jgi:hypothetical protein